ncbi:MAG: hypothetical protein JST_000176 [Candidatus Parcubacteria bacterium]|jgi:hypothetical protein|nr:MAG: hypothetical protein JST_1580 [Candidatus Parcubacteria bacterium]
MKKQTTIGLLTLAALSWAPAAQAVCPVCVVAVGAGLGLSRRLGIDDSITGLWIGGLTVAMIMWTINWLRLKLGQKKFWPAVKCGTILLFIALIAWPLNTQGFLGHPLNKLWGVDKVLLGTILGGLVFWVMSVLYVYLKKENNDKAYFPFQKVVMPFGALTFFSLIFYFVTK